MFFNQRKVISMKKQIAVILGSILLLTFGGLGVAQVGTSSMQGQKASRAILGLTWLKFLSVNRLPFPEETLQCD